MSSTPPTNGSSVKSLEEILLPGESAPEKTWQVQAIINRECLSYVVWNEEHKEALLIDPKLEEKEAYLSFQKKLSNYLWVAVIDTHTHADHISIAAAMAESFKAPLLMHSASPSQRVHLRITQQTLIPTHSGPITFIPSPGHTPDGICVVWGPFVFSGDTVLHGDVGRDDLPGGDPASHYDSLQTLRKFLKPEHLILPGHDFKGGRASSWATQLKINSSITQPREEYIQESAAFDAPAPELLKKSLAENFK